MNRLYIVLLFVPLIWSCKPDSPAGTNVRPSNFPDFLKPSSRTIDVQYRNAETGGVPDGVYSLLYLVEEDFPPKSTMKFVQQELSSAGFFRVKYLMQALPQQAEMPYCWQSNRHREAGYMHLEWGEHWVHKERCESVHVVYRYRYKIGEDIPSIAEIYMGYSTEKAPMSVYVKKYKEHYPKEEWEKDASEIDYDRVN